MNNKIKKIQKIKFKYLCNKHNKTIKHPNNIQKWQKEIIIKHYLFIKLNDYIFVIYKQQRGLKINFGLNEGKNDMEKVELATRLIFQLYP